MKWRGTLHRCKQLRPHTWVPKQIQSFGQQWLSSCVELLFPSMCLLCGESTPDGRMRICVDCHSALTENGLPRCPRCAKPLPKHSQAEEAGCPLCRQKRWRFEQAIALGTYGGVMRDLVLRIKQSRHEPLCLAAGELVAERIRFDTADSPPDFVAPVPMHWLRKILRGVNDAEVLAEAISMHLKAPLRMNLLRCLRPTRKQGTLLPNERRLNVRGAYRVRRRTDIKGAHVLVVDDVMTTGATANEVAKVLHLAGAARVTIAVVARGIGFD